jgi:hypothetical protein
MAWITAGSAMSWSLAKLALITARAKSPIHGSAAPRIATRAASTPLRGKREGMVSGRP